MYKEITPNMKYTSEINNRRSNKQPMPKKNLKKDFKDSQEEKSKKTLKDFQRTINQTFETY